MLNKNIMEQKLTTKNCIITREDRLCYGSPAHIPLIELCNIFRSSEIGIRTMPTNLAFNKSTMPDSFIVMTDRTGLRSMSWIDINNPNSLSQSLVFNKTLELPESPLMNPFIISGSFSDSFKFFHDDYVAIIQVSNNIFADIVIAPSHKPSPASRNLFEFSLGSLRAFALKNRNKPVMLDSQLLDIFSIKSAIRSDSNLIDPEVNTQNPVTMLRAYGIFPEECESEIIFFFVLSKQTFPDFPTKILQGIIRNLNRNFNSTFNSRNAQNIIFKTETSWIIISDRNLVDKWFASCFLNHPTGLFYTGNRKLGSQSHLPQVLINKRMEFDIIPDSHFPNLVNTKLKPLFVKFNSLNYDFINLNLNWNTSQYGSNSRNSNYLNISESISPPKPKGMGIQNAKLI